MQEALHAYVALGGKQRKSSSFTRAAHDQFPQRLSVCCRQAGLPDWRRRNLELLFSFCSDFVHSGYVSVLAIGGPGSEVIMGGPGDACTPKAENFAELKQRLLVECAGAYADLLVPMLRHGIGRTLAADMPADWAASLDVASAEINDVRAILNRRLVQPVRDGLVGSGAAARIDCMCGGHVDLHPSHHEWDRFCPRCGSRFALHEVGDEVDYVVSATGISDVLGGDAPKIAALDSAARTKLDRIAARHSSNHEDGGIGFPLITDLDGCDVDTLEVPSQVTSTPRGPEKKECQSFTFVAAKSLARCLAIRIRCNCGVEVTYLTANRSNVCQCPRCRTVIGLIGVTGDGASVSILNPDGSPGQAPIQARNRFIELGVARN